MNNYFHSISVKAVLLLISFVLLASYSNAQCVLTKGDIVFTGYDLIDDQVDGTNQANGRDDRFSFVILRDISIGTEIFFTDLGWTKWGNFQTTNRAKTDGVISWRANVAYPAGTEVTINTKFLLSADKGIVTGVLENYETAVDYPSFPSEYMSLAEISGDQIFAFTGNYLSSPTLIAAMSINTNWSDNLEDYESTSGKSMLPSVLSSGAQNLSISRVDPTDSEMRTAYTARFKSSGIVNGSAAAIVSTLNTVSNWELSNSETPYVEFETLTNGNTFTLALPVIYTNPVDANGVCPTGSTFFEVFADATACSYQWQIFNTSTFTWENLANGGVYSNVTGSKLFISNVTGLNAKKYRVRVYGTGLVISTEASINVLPALAITTLSLPDAAKYVSYNQQLTQTGGKASYFYSIDSGSSLPAGMTLSFSGMLGGTPTVHGTYNFTIKVTDGCGTVATKPYTLNISPEPKMTALSVPAYGLYRIGDNLSFTVTYDANVTVINAPTLELVIGSKNAYAAYLGGSGTNSLTFRYTVQSGDLDEDGIMISGISIDGGSIKSAGGTNADNSLINVGPTSYVNVDGVIPVINSVSSTLADGLYNLGTVIPITLTFSENVTVFGTPQLILETGTTDRVVNYVSGSGTNSLLFNYTVQSGDYSADLDYLSSGALDLSIATIQDFTGNNANTALPVPGASGSLGANKNLVIDSQAPVITSVTSTTANGSYRTGDVINVMVNLSEAVFVTGTPTISLNSGGIASYVLGSGTSVLYFNYIVDPENSTPDLDYLNVNSLGLEGGTIKDAADNSAIITLPEVGSANSIGGQKNIAIDAIKPLIASASVPANGIYRAGQNLDFVITYNEPVTVNSFGGTPYISITLNTGGTVRADYIAGSGTSSLTFRYNIVNGHFDNDGITLLNSLILNGSLITDAVGNNAVIADINFASTASVLVDGVAPSATIVVADTFLSAGETTLVTITFNEAILGLGSVNLTSLNGQLSSLTTIDNGITWIATLTPTENIKDATNLIILNNNGVFDVAGNVGTGITISNNYEIDTEIPTLISTNIASNNINPALAKTGDIITLNLIASEVIFPPIITISGHAVTPTGSGNTYTATYTMNATDSEGIVSFNVAFSNLAGNNGIPVSQTSNNSSITFDRTAPIIPVGLVTTAGNKQVELNWTANPESDLVSYNIFGGTSSNPNTLIQKVLSTGNTFVHTGLTNGTTYYYRISASDNVGNESLFSSEVTAIPMQEQTITFNTLPIKTYGDLDFDAGATVSSGLAIKYSSDNELVAKVNSNGKIQIIGAGIAIITASVPGNDVYIAAPSQTQLLTVNKKDINLSLNNLPLITKVYDGDNIAKLAPANYSLNGLKAGDIIEASGTITYDDKNVGTDKAITGIDFLLIGEMKDNYNLITSSAKTIGEVIQKGLSIIATDQTKVYGEILTFDGTEFKSDGLLTGDKITSLSLTSNGALANSIAGSNYTISPASAIGIGLNNYAINYVGGTLTVNKKDLIITAENKTRFAGTENPIFTFTYQGFVNGEDQSIFSPIPEAETLANSASAIGEYAISIKPVVSLNYNITYRQGLLKIVPGAPKSLSFVPELFLENSVSGTLVGTMSSESDDSNAIFTYSLVNGAGDADNALFGVSGNKLLSLGGPDFERKSTYSVRVSSATQHGFSLEKILIINLTDVNEAPSLAFIPNQVICYTTSTQEISLSGINAGPESTKQTVALSVSTNSTLFSELTINKDGILRYRANEGMSGIATIKVTVKDNGGIANGGIDSFSREFTITVNPLPQILLSSNKGNSISKGEIIILTATGGSTYSWKNAYGIISGQQSAKMTIRPAETTTYLVTVTTAEGCISEQQITVEVKNDYKLLQATNILTPNGDGINDRFLIRNIDLYPNSTVKIFDRSGRILFSKSNYVDEWDGTYQGKMLAEDTYYYIVDFGPIKGKMRGYISLLGGQ